MRKVFLMSYLLAMAVIIMSCQKDQTTEVNNPVSPQIQALQNQVSGIIEGKYIIVMDDTPVKSSLSYQEGQEIVRAEAMDILSKTGNKSESISVVYSHSIKGFAAELSEEEALIVTDDDRVKYVERDHYVILKKPDGAGGGGGGGSSQVTPWGITRVGGGATYTGNGSAWILDTGIDLDHPDLNVDVSRSVAFGQNNPDDGHGHGSHCAGTIAGIDNDFGVVGVAAGAPVVAVRILDRRGYGATSDCIAGVDYVGANAAPGDVANMSVGYPASTALDNAVVNAASNGIYFALAAGNDGLHTYNSPQPSPGRVNGTNIWTVSAMDSNDDFAYFSNYGNPPVELCGPGVSVYSCYKRGGYTTMSGTSMATPHVCGTLLMTNGNPNTDGTVNGDPDGTADDIVHL
jgi:hypothetical protein